MRLPDRWFMAYRACDNNGLCQRLLLADPNGPLHVFDGLLESLPAVDQKQVSSMRPLESDDRATKAKKHLEQRDYMYGEKSRLFGLGVRAQNCLKHPGSACTLSWAPDETEHGLQPLKVNFAGPACLPWAGMGGHEGFAHPSVESLHTWLAQMTESDWDLVYIEEAAAFPWETFQTPMSEKYDCHRVVFGAEDFST
jgi:hypothetical protein